VAVPILKQGPFLIASIQAALTDTDVLRLQDDVMRQVAATARAASWSTSPRST
jgi:hypothetical protein